MKGGGDNGGKSYIAHSAGKTDGGGGENHGDIASRTLCGAEARKENAPITAIPAPSLPFTSIITA